MRPFYGRQLVALVLALCQTGCRTGVSSDKTASDHPPVLADGAAVAAGFSMVEVDAVRRTYATKCGRCHGFYHPGQYDDTAWRLWMNKMSKKARLKPDQAEFLSRYLEALRHVSPP